MQCHSRRCLVNAGRSAAQQLLQRCQTTGWCKVKSKAARASGFSRAFKRGLGAALLLGLKAEGVCPLLLCNIPHATHAPVRTRISSCCSTLHDTGVGIFNFEIGNVQQVLKCQCSKLLKAAIASNGYSVRISQRTTMLGLLDLSSLLTSLHDCCGILWPLKDILCRIEAAFGSPSAILKLGLKSIMRVGFGRFCLHFMSCIVLCQ